MFEQWNIPLLTNSEARYLSPTTQHVAGLVAGLVGLITMCKIRQLMADKES